MIIFANLNKIILKSIGEIDIMISPFDLNKFLKDEYYLELRQYKNNLMESKCMLFLKLPRFFLYCIGE